MAGKSGRGKSKGKGLTSIAAGRLQVDSNQPDLATPPKDNAGAVESPKGDANNIVDSENNSPTVDGKGVNKKENADAPATNSKQAEGELHLYPISVKTQSGEKLELQLSPGDSVMDVRQFLLDAPETCYYTCYDLILHSKDGSIHPLEDFNEISEVADITTGGCSLEMVAALYDDRSIRSHVRRARELLSLSTLHTSYSTSLAMQHETAKPKSTDTTKAGASELDGLGFMEDTTSSLGNLMTLPVKEMKSVESVMFSSFNPPPSYRRLQGDLIYVDVATLEGNKFCITGTTKAFYVNSSTDCVLDPKPLKSAYEASTLIGLLQKLSSKFKKGFREILEQKGSAHPFENVHCLLPANSWLGAYPLPEHKRDASRAEDALVLSFGSELIGMQRDWNEELQSCREFPHTSLQERILRDRALYKVTCDFVDAAVKGAVGVISRCISPINPTDPECFHMYVHNNIFFSYAVDAEVGQTYKDHPSTVNINFEHVPEQSQDTASSPDPAKASYDKSCGTNGNSAECIAKSMQTEAPCVTDLTSDGSAEAQLADSEQATYASANNDLKGTRAYQEADVPGLYTLAMAIIDHRGFRVVAQSIIPGILQGDKSESLQYGSVDNGKKICWNESFHSKVLEAAKRLHLKEHTVLDGAGNNVKLAAPVECKGIMGSDDRHYLLDLMRVTPRDANYTGAGSRFCILRSELIASFCQAEATKKSNSEGVSRGEVSQAPDSENHTRGHAIDTSMEVPEKGSEECEPAPAYSTSQEVFLNPNAFTEFKLAGSEEELAADEADVKKAASYLIDVILPKFIKDLCSLEVSPMDGQTLTDALHAHGINVRYLGKVADMVRHLPHLWDICMNEIVVRSVKHIIKDFLRETPDYDLGPAIAHFLNCFIGHVPDSGIKGSTNNMQLNQKKDLETHQSPRISVRRGRWSQGAPSSKNQQGYMLLTSERLWFSIQEFARFKYQFGLPDDAGLCVKKVSVVRNLCQKVGITIVARKYDLNATAPFQTSDVLNLQPVVKHSVPICTEATELMDKGKGRLAEGMLNEAYTLFSEAFSILQQVTGPMHREVANCCRYLAMVLYHAGDMAGAIMQQHKELIINERCLGLDHPDTAHSYGNMALFYHGLNQTELALRHMARTLLLLSLSSGPDHPDVSATFINVAMMYQDIGNMNTALRYLQEALKRNERLLGEEHIQTAVCYHALAIAFNCMGTYKLSFQHEKRTYDILVKQLGEEDSRTRDSESWMKTFKLREQQVIAQKQKGQAVDAASTQKAIDMLKAHPDLVQAFQAAAIGSGNMAGSSVNKTIGAALMGDGLSRGRGFDERAAKAAAEVRKKAAAKGLPVRQNGIPVQTLAPLTQLLNIINSGAATAETSQKAEPNGTKKEAETGSTLNGTSEENKESNRSVENSQDQAPVGLGHGLTSLDSKKQKSKVKAAT